MYFDLVVVGGGIAGSSLAGFLAEQGVDVLILEKTSEFRDENRGELLWPWGVREAQLLGVYDILVRAGGHPVGATWAWNSLTPGVRGDNDLAKFFPEVDGSLNLGHPQGRQALLDYAEEKGAGLRRGVGPIEVSQGSVSWVENGAQQEARCRLIVGADGRRSAVRQQAGIQLHRGPIEHYAAGVLLASEDIPSDANIVARENSTHFLSFPQANGHARVYQCIPSEARSRFGGREGEKRFLELSDLECLPNSTAWSEAETAGPLGTFPCGDTWVDSPLTDGVALIGDAGGYNNLLIGQGLSLALRDARILGELLIGDDWSVKGLAEYATERTERLNKQRFTAHLVAAGHRFFRDADHERARFNELVAEDALLDGFYAEIFLGGLTRTTEEVADASQRLDAIEAKVTTY